MIDKALGYLIDKHDFSESPEGLARVLGQRGFALAAMGKKKESFKVLKEILHLNPTEKRVLTILPVLSGLTTSEKILETTHKTGRGI